MKELIKEVKRFQELAGIINENKYLINTIYTVPRNWFNSPLDILENNIFFLKKDNIIISGEIKDVEYNDDNFVAYVTFISSLDKSNFFDKLKSKSTRIEQWEIM
jgi:hypothetical protein